MPLFKDIKNDTFKHFDYQNLQVKNQKLIFKIIIYIKYILTNEEESN